MVKFVSEKIKMKSSARLAAVQATYMIEFGQLPVDAVIKSFINGEVGRYAIEDDALTHEENLAALEDIDSNYFATLARGVQEKKEYLEKAISSFLKEGWAFDRMDGTLRALLLCAVYEIMYNPEVDAKVIIQEYVDLAYAFFSKGEPKMVNALLDKMKSLR